MSNYTNEKFRNDLKQIGFPADENLDSMLDSVGKLNQNATCCTQHRSATAKSL